MYPVREGEVFGGGWGQEWGLKIWERELLYDVGGWLGREGNDHGSSGIRTGAAAKQGEGGLNRQQHVLRGRGDEVVAAVIENVTDSQLIAARAPKTRPAAPPCKTAPAKKAAHTNPVKHTVPSTPSGKKALVKKAPVRTGCHHHNRIINSYEAREEHLTEFSVGNVPEKELILHWYLMGLQIMLATIKVVTKHLVNKWAMIDKDKKAYIQNGGTTKSRAAALPEAKYFYLYMENKGFALWLLPRMSPCLEWTRSGKLSKKTARTTPPRTTTRMGFSVMRWRGMVHEQNHDGQVCPYSVDCHWKKAATRNMTKTIATTKRKAKKIWPTPVEDAYTCDPCLKKLNSTNADTGAVNNELVIPCHHNLKLPELHLQNELQMVQDKIKADQQSARYKNIQPAGIDYANRADPIGVAS
ncbi:hypothetical protein BDK51DRAFT_26015 [Blyttiomyces helicus]|uniref:Uncharacterized protein n=1 Tax=Blyttiomyces helicus TaxID=388810 RepID=A0A4P9WN30_9FUNG|nr:hypothetical protein BDK51DRAFT_26015 [Blyttiomyces helicus]|eukprot:RKO93655.1 hypothetical protein BDK51DRAFT_26015 [Blyttiomyces helicus]